MASRQSEPLGLDCVYLVLEKYLSTDRFVIKSFELRPASDRLLGFIGEHSKLNVKYALNGETHYISLFVKSVPRCNQFRFDFNKKYKFFERESAVYRHIFGQLMKEKESDVWHANCLLNLKYDLIFEDLNIKGFEMLKAESTLDKEHGLVALTSIARLHATSLIIEETATATNKEVYRLEDHFEDIFNSGNLTYNSWFRNGVMSCLALVGESKKYGRNTIYFNKVKAKWHQVFKEGLDLLSTKNLRNVLCHTDLWNNNMMFRHDAGGNPIQCVLVDFQAARLSPPEADVMSFIYMNLDKQTRDDCYEELLLHYHTELTKRLKENNITCENIIPRKKFLEYCDVYRKWGLVHTLILFQFIFVNNSISKTFNEAENFQKLVDDYRGDILVEQNKSDAVFSNRIMNNLEELIDLYIVRA